MRKFSPALAMAAVLASCETESPPGEAARETLASGAVLVRHADLPATDAAGPDVAEARVDLRFGSVDGADPNFIFADIRGVEASGDGEIYVLDSQAREVRVFGPDGEYRRTIARSGEGPGEITEANGIILRGDSLLWINDYRSGRIMAVDPNGVERRRFPQPVQGRASYMWTGTFDDDGGYWRSVAHSEMDNDPSQLERRGVDTYTARLYYKSYELSTGTVDSTYLGVVQQRLYAYTAPGIPHGFLGIPFDSREIEAVDPGGGFWRADNGEYRIARVDEAAGDTLLVIEAALSAEAVTRADRTRVVRRAVEQRGDDMRAHAEAVAAAMPDTKPILENLFVDDEGLLWVRRLTPGGAAAFFDRFSRDGDYRGSVRLGFAPAAGRIRVRHGSIYSWIVDELDVPHVVRARLAPM